VAVDAAGNVYLCDVGKNRVVKLNRGSYSDVTLPFTGIDNPLGVAVDTAGNVYVADLGRRVLELPVGSSTQSQLPFSGLGGQTEGLDVALDSHGTVYVADTANNRVPKLSQA